MKAKETPMKIYLNPDAVPHNQSGNFLFIHNSDIDESKCTIEYTRTDTFIENTVNWLINNTDITPTGIKNYRKAMKRE
jgi:hypothetical protein